jgi:hypothetical protein
LEAAADRGYAGTETRACYKTRRGIVRICIDMGSQITWKLRRVFFTYEKAVAEVSRGYLHRKELVIPENNGFPLVKGHLVRHRHKSPILHALLALSELRATCFGRSSSHLIG